ncbi:MAG TPA: PhzF family phenazine biosynthesis protein [Mycobacteriales bacterium]|nr:PhzF family phenazine biosynthesis protein [Mycobacteriales bacterium]
MTDLTYHVVDVFTDRAYAGNPLAVVLGADDLTTPQLAALAREFNLSETAFPMAGDDECDYRIRIFTPETELPFAGHPSVGTAWLLASLGRIGHGRVVQRCGAGLLPLTVDANGAELTGGTPTADAATNVASTGLPFVFAEVPEEEVATATVGTAQRHEVEGTAGVAMFAWDPAARTSHARVFAFGAGVPEDPATGSAATAFGAWLAAKGYVPADGETAYTVRQGAEIGRPSTLYGTVVTRGGAAVEVRVAGGVVPVANGTIRVP